MLFLFSILRTEFNIIPVLSSSTHTFGLDEEIKKKNYNFQFHWCNTKKDICVFETKRQGVNDKMGRLTFLAKFC